MRPLSMILIHCRNGYTSWFLLFFFCLCLDVDLVQAQTLVYSGLGGSQEYILNGRSSRDSDTRFNAGIIHQRKRFIYNADYAVNLEDFAVPDRTGSNEMLSLGFGWNTVKPNDKQEILTPIVWVGRTSGTSRFSRNLDLWAGGIGGIYVFPTKGWFTGYLQLRLGGWREDGFSPRSYLWYSFSGGLVIVPSAFS